MCAHGSMARMAGEILQTPRADCPPGALRLRGAGDARAWSSFSGSGRGAIVRLLCGAVT